MPGQASEAVISGKSSSDAQHPAPSLTHFKNLRGDREVVGKALAGTAHEPCRGGDPDREQAFDRNAVSMQGTF